MASFRWLLLASTLLGVAAFNCGDFSDCGTCTSSPTWLPGTNCRWCPKDFECHDAGDVVWNHCHVDENIYDKAKCPAGPAPPKFPPAPAPSPETNEFKVAILKKLFELLGIDADAASCVKDVGGAKVQLDYFAQDLDAKQWESAVVHLSRGISSLANAVAGCDIPQVQNKLDTLAHGTRWANITAAGDKAVAILVGASDLWHDMEAVAAAVKAQDPTAVGNSLGTLLNKWTAVSGGCGDDDKVCHVIDGLLKVLSVSAKDVEPCKAALAPAVSSFEAGAAAFQQKSYSVAVEEFATGLDTVATATKTDACGLSGIADAVEDVAPLLKQAIVSIDASGIPQIVVGSADVYLELRAFVADISKGQYAGAGIQIGALLAQLKASGCNTKMCIVVEGLLASLQVGLTDLTACESDLDDSWQSLNQFVSKIRQGSWKDALAKMGDFFGDIGTATSKCGVPQLGSIFEDTAQKCKEDSVASVAGEVVQLFVSGSDVALDLQKIIVHIENGQWAALGSDLGGISDSVTRTGCNSFVCHLVEGILTEADMVLTDLKACEADLRAAEAHFVAGTQNFADNQPETGVKLWGAGLNTLANAVSDCGVAKQLTYLAQESNVLGLGNATVLDEAAAILVHGSDFYSALFDGLQDIGRHDYRSAGEKFGKVLKDLDAWTNTHLCSSGGCFILNGVMQYLAELEGDARACKDDLQNSFGNFSEAVSSLVTKSSGSVQFKSSSGTLTSGIHELGEGLSALGDAVGRCHLTELAALLAAAAAKLGLAPEIGWLEEVLHILIDGKDIVTETAKSCIDFADGNWPGFGYNLVKLIEKLLGKMTVKNILAGSMKGKSSAFVVI